jgi:S1-C subfamily serine protease
MKLVQIVLWCTLYASVALAQTAQDVARVGFASTVTVLVYDSSGEALGLGSGFVVAPELVVTNAHVVAGASRLLIRPIGEASTREADLLEHHSEEQDLVVVRVPGLNLPALRLSTEEMPSVGETVFAVGSPLGLEGTFTQGIVSGYRTVEGMSLMQITAPISPGSSGGPVLNAAGAVVGVAVGAFTLGQNLNFAVPLPSLQALLGSPPARAPVASLAGADSQPVAPGEARGLVEAVVVRALGISALDALSVTVQNRLPRPIRDVELLVVVYDRSGAPIDTYQVRLRQTIFPGLAVHTEVRLARPVARIAVGSDYGAGPPVTRIEFRVLTFEYAD